jgi:hypothetical protein
MSQGRINTFGEKNASQARYSTFMAWGLDNYAAIAETAEEDDRERAWTRALDWVRCGLMGMRHLVVYANACQGRDFLLAPAYAQLVERLQRGCVFAAGTADSARATPPRSLA